MESPRAVSLVGVSKNFKLYASNRDRLKELLSPSGKSYHREFHALSNINLQVGKGEILGILGRNGSGKSTLLKIINGILTPNSGTVEVTGTVSALLELGTGFNPEFTGMENVYFYGVVNGFGKEFMDSRIDEIVAFADLGQYIHQPLKSYSSGMKTRLGFAVAINISPDILILDEVLAVGDELFRRKCYAKMEEFLDQGTTILYVSHDLNSIIQMCTRAVFLHEGRLLASGEPRDIGAFYQQVIYASPESRLELIAGLENSMSGQSATQKPVLEEPGSNKAVPEEAEDRVWPSVDSDYLEEFTPSSRLEYRNEEIDIVDAHIQSMDGRRVNILQPGKSYMYRVEYRSKSDRSFRDVTFGFAIKNEKGTVLSALDAHRSRGAKISLKEFEPGAVHELKIIFDCMLRPGTYYTDSGLSSFETGEQMVLNRIVDNFSFKVEVAPPDVFGGLFTCMRQMQIISQDGEQQFALR